MVAVVPVEPTGNQDIDGLLTGLRWSSLNLTYSFPTAAALYGAGYGWGEPLSNFAGLNPAQAAAARAAFGMIASVTNLDFAEVTGTARAHADLRLARSDTPGSAWTYTPDGSHEGGDTWFGNSVGWYDAPVPGDYAFYTFLHEIAHAVGLKHGHEAGGLGVMSADRDSMEYSATTYRSYVGAAGQYLENEANGHAQSLMMYDIAALQHMYGADYSTNSGNTSYSWSPATGEMFVGGLGQGAPAGNRIFLTLWDGGGLDTYDLSNYRSDLTIDLRPGAWTKTSGEQTAYLGGGNYARGNIANALLHQGDPRSLIEQALGGSGDDRILGNTAANLLAGGSGADRLYGFEGNDVLLGGRGNDVLAGGAGRDSFLFDTKLHRSANRDRILDFSPADDTVRLDNSVFTKLGKTGKLPSSAFWTGKSAHDPSDRIVYDKGKGALLYDADGSGRSAPVVFATLDKNLKITSADFLVV
ncbi:M10 family metallopeptidase [Microvirga sp. GCM10011540]|uniref:M10 family metallopeptidase n=1 Tax=Microvirga sp. GCM10011540 TaxID=3317338 RepID=UPI003609D525